MRSDAPGFSRLERPRLPNHDIATVATFTTATKLNLESADSLACSDSTVSPQRYQPGKDVRAKMTPLIQSAISVGPQIPMRHLHLISGTIEFCIAAGMS